MADGGLTADTIVGNRESNRDMYLIAIAWGYVVMMMAAAEATSATGTLLGAFVTLLLYGVLPLSLLMYIIGTPARKRRRKAAETAGVEARTTVASGSLDMAPPDIAPLDITPDGSGQPAGATVAAERKET